MAAVSITPQKIQKRLMVRQGDNWFNLAQRYNVSPSQLAQANRDIKRLLPGQTVVIPSANASLQAGLQAAQSLAPEPGERRQPYQPPPPQPPTQPKTNPVTSANQYRPPTAPTSIYNVNPYDTTLKAKSKQQPVTGPQGVPGGMKPSQAKAAVTAQNPPTAAGSRANQPAPAIPNAAAQPNLSYTPAEYAAYQQRLANASNAADYQRIKTQWETAHPATQVAAANLPRTADEGDLARVTAEWKVLNPNQPVPEFSQAFLLRLANASNQADYIRILQNWSASAGGSGYQPLSSVLNKAVNGNYPWPAAIMPWEVAQNNIDTNLLNQLYEYDPRLGYWVIRSNVQGAAGLGGGGAATAGGAGGNGQGWSGGAGMPAGTGTGRGSASTSNPASSMGLIDWRF